MITRALAAVALSCTSTVASAQLFAPHVSVKVHCGTHGLHGPVATVRWAPSGSFQNTHLDYSLYRDGFQRGLFASVSFTPNATAIATAISYSSASPSRDSSLTQYQLKVRSVTQRNDTVTVQLTGMDPGVFYYWRVSSIDVPFVVFRWGISSMAPSCGEVRSP